MDLTEQSFNPLYEQFQSQQETKVEELAFLNHHDGGNCTQKIADYFRNESATGQSGFDELTTISTACSSAANAIMLGAKLLKQTSLLPEVQKLFPASISTVSIP